MTRWGSLTSLRGLLLAIRKLIATPTDSLSPHPLWILTINSFTLLPLQGSQGWPSTPSRTTQMPLPPRIQVGWVETPKCSIKCSNSSSFSNCNSPRSRQVFLTPPLKTLLYFFSQSRAVMIRGILIHSDSKDHIILWSGKYILLLLYDS